MIKVHEILNLSMFGNFHTICGENYLNNNVTVAAILEYESSRIDYEGYDYGYFVILSYFFAEKDPELVHHALKTLIRKKVSAIAIKMLPEQTLPEEIVQLAVSNHVPLFSFYEEFVEDLIININESLKTRAMYVVLEEKINALLVGEPTPESVQNVAMEINPDFLPNIITAKITAKEPADNLMFHAYFNGFMYRQYRSTETKSYSFVKSGSGILLICSYDENVEKLSPANLLRQVTDLLSQAGFPAKKCYIGINDDVVPLNKLNISIKKALDANTVCNYLQKDFMTYNSMGIYKYIMSLVSNTILYDDADKQIRILLDYDKKHEANLWETLTVLVKNNGDFSKTSSELFQHSNTIRYRIRKAVQLLSLPEDTSLEELTILVRMYLLHNLIR